MRLLKFTFLFLAVGVFSQGCKTPNKEGSSLAGLGALGNINACKRTKARILEAYRAAELRSLALKGEGYLAAEAMQGNKAAALVFDAIAKNTTIERLLRVAEGTQDIPQEKIDAWYNNEFIRNGGMKNALSQYAMKSVTEIQSLVTELKKPGTPAQKQARSAEAREILETNMQLVDSVTAELLNAKNTQRATGAEVLYESVASIQKLGRTLLGAISSVQSEMAVETASLDVSVKGLEIANSKAAVDTSMAEYLKQRYASTSNPRSAAAAASQALTLTMHNELAFANERSVETRRAVVEIFGSNAQRQAHGNSRSYNPGARANFAELMVLQSAIESYDISLGDQAKVNKAKQRFNELASEFVKQRYVQASNTQVDFSERPSTFVEQLSESQRIKNEFDIKSDFAAHKVAQKRANAVVERAKVRK